MSLNQRQTLILGAFSDALASLGPLLRTACSVRGCHRPATQTYEERVAGELIYEQLCSFHSHLRLRRNDALYVPPAGLA